MNKKIKHTYRVNAMIPEERGKQLERIMAQRSKKQAEIVREAVILYLEKHGKQSAA